MLAVIPAKSRSTRCKDKNFRTLGDKRLVEWTMKAACESSTVTEVLVVLDAGDIDFADWCNDYWTCRTIFRHPSYSRDHVSAVAVVQWAVEALAWTGDVAMLLPTSPFRTAADIDECYRLWRAAEAASCISVIPVRAEAMKGMDRSGLLVPSDARYESNGAIQIAHSSTVLGGGFHTEATLPYVMTPESGLDIDTEGDWTLAEGILRERRSGHQDNEAVA